MFKNIVDEFSKKLQKSSLINLPYDEFSNILFKFINNSSEYINNFIKEEEQRIVTKFNEFCTCSESKDYKKYFDTNIINKIHIEVEESFLLIKADEYIIFCEHSTLSFISNDLYCKLIFIFLTYQNKSPENIIHYINKHSILHDKNKLTSEYSFGINALVTNVINNLDGEIQIYNAITLCEEYKKGINSTDIDELINLFETFVGKNKINNVFHKRKLISKSLFEYNKKSHMLYCEICDEAIQINNVGNYDELCKSLEHHSCECKSNISFNEVLDHINSNTTLDVDKTLYNQTLLNLPFHKYRINGICKDCGHEGIYAIPNQYFKGDFKKLIKCDSCAVQEKTVMNKPKKTNKDSKRYLYIIHLKVGDTEFGKYGISYSPNKRFNNFLINNSNLEFKNKTVIQMTNHHVQMLEYQLKCIQNTFVTKDIFSDGYTETFDINDKTITDKIRNGIISYMKENNFPYENLNLFNEESYNA